MPSLGDVAQPWLTAKATLPMSLIWVTVREDSVKMVRCEAVSMKDTVRVLRWMTALRVDEVTLTVSGPSKTSTGTGGNDAVTTREVFVVWVAAGGLKVTRTVSGVTKVTQREPSWYPETAAVAVRRRRRHMGIMLSLVKDNNLWVAYKHFI